MKPGETQTLIQSTADLNTTYLGSRESNLGVEENIGLNDEKRLTHVLNVGPTGYGKSQLLTHVALQDAEKDHGLAVINPKGDLIDEFLAKIPKTGSTTSFTLTRRETRLHRSTSLNPM